MRTNDTPSLALVDANRWDCIPVPDDWTPSQTASIVVPYYQAKAKLDLVLAALQRQTYPARLTETIVVDDGSDPPLTPDQVPENVRIVHQERCGFGVARARNLGAASAYGDILVFADGDMVLPQDNVMAHARWHHLRSDLYTALCDLRYVDDNTPVDISNLDGAPHTKAGYITRHLVHTGNLTTAGDDIFSILPGPNFTIRRDSYWKIGGNSPKFRHWGLEDTHLLYRAYAHGLVIVPVTDTYGLHLGTPTVTGFGHSAATAEQLIPHRNFRQPGQKRVFSVPEYVVTVKSTNRRVLLALALDILDDSPYDLVVRLNAIALGRHDVDYLASRFEGDPRVRITGTVGTVGTVDPLQDFPDSAFHLLVDSAAPLKRNLVTRVRRALGDDARLVMVDDESHIDVMRSWMAHRLRNADYAALYSGRHRRLSARPLRAKRMRDTRTPIDIPRPGRARRIARKSLKILLR